MVVERFPRLFPDDGRRRPGSDRVLEHEPDLGADEAPELRIAVVGDDRAGLAGLFALLAGLAAPRFLVQGPAWLVLVASVTHRSADDPRSRREQREAAHEGERLPRCRLADDRKDLALRHGEGDAVKHLHPTGCEFLARVSNGSWLVAHGALAVEHRDAETFDLKE